MWSWVLHRITGVAIFFFLLVHVLDTALIRVSPEAYNAVIGTYKNPIMGLGEVALVAAIAYHALQRAAHHRWSTSGRGRRVTSVSCGGACSGCGSCTMVGFVAAPPHARLREARGSLMTTDASPIPAAPRAAAAARGPNLEKWGWIYMRVSGVCWSS